VFPAAEAEGAHVDAEHGANRSCHFVATSNSQTAFETADMRVPTTFQIETLAFSLQSLRSEVTRRPREIPYLAMLSAVKDGPHLAIVLSMTNNAVVHRNTGVASFLRGVRALAEASLVALAFGFVIFLIGLPLALSVRVVHESFSGLARLGEETGPLAVALVSIAAVVGGIMLTAVFARAVVGFEWRGALRQKSPTSDRAIESVPARQLRTAAS
jgi:hypothetical protein